MTMDECSQKVQSLINAGMVIYPAEGAYLVALMLFLDGYDPIHGSRHMASYTRVLLAERE